MIYKCNQTINEKYINDNNIGPNDIIQIQNTAMQTSEDLKTVPSYIKIYVVGGYDPEKERRYSSQRHLKRNTFNAEKLMQIVSAFENIEKNIDSSWSDLAKSLYIYYTLRKKMNISENGIALIDEIDDYALAEITDTEIRGLRGILRGDAVCAGLAQIYKEMLERQGIKCKYRAKHGIHAWNEVKINDEYYPVDLTLEIADRNKRVTLGYFMNNPEFYNMFMHEANDKEGECISRVLPDKVIQDAQIEIFDSLQEKENNDADK